MKVVSSHGSYIVVSLKYLKKAPKSTAKFGVHHGTIIPTQMRRSVYGLDSYMNGEKLPHEKRGNGLDKIFPSYGASGLE